MRPKAYEQATGLMWEGGDILAPTPHPQRRVPETAPDRAAQPWCEHTVYGDNWKHPKAYADAAAEVVDAVNASPQLSDWWRPTGLERLEINIGVGPVEANTNIGIKRESSVRRGKRTARADFTVDSIRLKGKNKGIHAYWAAQDLEHILSRVASTLKLGPPPALPQPRNAEPPSQKALNNAARLAELRRRFKRVGEALGNEGHRYRPPMSRLIRQAATTGQGTRYVGRTGYRLTHTSRGTHVRGGEDGRAARCSAAAAPA